MSSNVLFPGALPLASAGSADIVVVYGMVKKCGLYLFTHTQAEQRGLLDVASQPIRADLHRFLAASQRLFPCPADKVKPSNIEIWMRQDCQVTVEHEEK